MTRRMLAAAVIAAMALVPTTDVAPSSAPVMVEWLDEWEQQPADLAAWDCLLGLGYRGTTSDHREALYPTRADLDYCR